MTKHFVFLSVSNSSYDQNRVTKAELLQAGIFFLIHLFAWEILLVKKLEIEETKTS